MKDELTKVLRDVADALGQDDPARLEMLSRIMADVAALQVRALAGEDVDQELRIVRASAANLDERVRRVASEHLMLWMQRLILSALMH